MLITMIFFAKTAKVRIGILQKLQFHLIEPDRLFQLIRIQTNFDFTKSEQTKYLQKKGRST